MENRNTLVSVQNVHKKYCKSLRKSMFYGMVDILRNSLGFSAKSHILRKKEFWAVNDASFELKQGEVLGIIGPNGSGKTTILKMINGIFWPDNGKISVNGKVGALIEVGAGFHPSLTGRENLYVNGAILGMSKKEIDDAYDSIIDFAEIGDFIDVPVKHYSSGMYIRLGFSIAIHCKPDILLVDEILAVGDSSFRAKCFAKMNEIKNSGKTSIIFISHNLLAVQRFCDRGIFIHNGVIKSIGEINRVINDYQTLINQLTKNISKNNSELPGTPHCTKAAKIENVEFFDDKNSDKKSFSHGNKFGIRIKYSADKIIEKPIIQISLMNSSGNHINTFGTHLDNILVPKIENKGTIECSMDTLPLLLNKYYISVSIYDHTHTVIHDYWNGALVGKYFEVLPNKVSSMMGDYTAICHFKTKWKF